MRVSEWKQRRIHVVVHDNRQWLSNGVWAVRWDVARGMRSLRDVIEMLPHAGMYEWQRHEFVHLGASTVSIANAIPRGAMTPVHLSKLVFQWDNCNRVRVVFAANEMDHTAMVQEQYVEIIAEAKAPILLPADFVTQLAGPLLCGTSDDPLALIATVKPLDEVRVTYNRLETQLNVATSGVGDGEMKQRQIQWRNMLDPDALEE